MLPLLPGHYDRWSQALELIMGELLPDQPVPLLKQRKRISREQAIRLWAEKRREGCQPYPPLVAFSYGGG